MKKIYSIRLRQYAKTFSKYELKVLLAKAFFSELRMPAIWRFYFAHYIRDIRRTRLRTICVKTRQIGGLVHFFNLFRMNFRDNALFTHYAGLKKKTW